MKNTNTGISRASSKDALIFEHYPVSRAVMIMVIPTIISQMLHVVYNFADTWFVGLTCDPNAVAAISLCLPVYNMLTAAGNLFGIGGDSVIARALGMGDYHRARRAFSAAFWGALAASLVYSLILLFVSRPLLLLIGGDSGSIDPAVSYTFITIILGGPPTILASVTAHLIRATGESKISGIGLTLGAVLNILLDPLFMFVLLPNGHEVVGAAIATALSNVVSLLYFLLYLYRHKDIPVYSVHTSHLRGAAGLLCEISRCGLPGFSMVALAMLSNCFLNSMIASMGSSMAMAAIGIVRKIDSLAYSVNQGITQGMLPLVSYCYSAGKKARMRAVIRLSSVLTVAFSLFSTLLSVLFAPQLIAFFIRDSETIRYGTAFLRVISLAIPVYSLTYIIIAVFQAVGQSEAPLLLSVFRKGPLYILLLFWIRHLFGVQYITWASPVIEVLTLVIALFMIIKLLRGNDVPPIS